MSTKWRRSKKHLKWLSSKTSDEANIKNHPRITHFEPLRATRTGYPPNLRSPQFYTQRKWKSPTPLIDVFQEENWITIIVEIAGFNKEAFKINVKDQKLTLSAKGNDRRYYKSLNLPKVVIPNVISTKYNNGVLQIKLRKAKKLNLDN